jgi:hypothetical protein
MKGPAGVAGFSGLSAAALACAAGISAALDGVGSALRAPKDSCEAAGRVGSTGGMLAAASDLETLDASLAAPGVNASVSASSELNIESKRILLSSILVILSYGLAFYECVLERWGCENLPELSSFALCSRRRYRSCISFMRLV